jgi:hypothetical protein
MFDILQQSFSQQCFKTDATALQVSLEGAVQALIAIFTSLPPLPNMTTPSSLATSNGEADQNPAIQTLLPASSSEVRLAAVQGLQSIALQHSSKGHQIFSPANVQQLLQPSLIALAQQYKAPQAVKGSLAPVGGKNGVAERQRKPTVGKLTGSAGVGNDRMTAEMHQRLCKVVRYAGGSAPVPHVCKLKARHFTHHKGGAKLLLVRLSNCSRSMH